jgi:hypothetical protein
VSDQVSEQGVTEFRKPGKFRYGDSETVVEVAYGILRRVGGHPDTICVLLHQWYVPDTFMELSWYRRY